MARAKKFSTYLFALGVLGYIGYHWFSGQTPVSVSPPAPPAVFNGADGQPGFALNPANTWPPAASDDSVQVPAPDLFGVNYYVVLDGSGSMNESKCSEGKRKIEVARTALSAFARSVPAQANLGLAVFDRRGLSERLPLGRNNRNGFSRAIEEVQVSADTPLKRAVELAYSRLLDQGRRQLGYGEYHLVIVTDGLASPSQKPTSAVNRILAESPVVFHTVGFCIDERHSLNQPGRTYYRSANNPQALQQGLETVLAEAPNFAVSQFSD
jgi:Ca-activated chloride channel family protein